VDKSEKGKQTPPPPPKKNHGLVPSDLKIYSPEKKPKIISVTSISVNFSFASIKISASSELDNYHF
jgi:hypothetical protein